MNYSEETIVSDDVKGMLKMMTEFRESYTSLRNEYMKLQDENFTLKNMLKISQDSDKQQMLFRSNSEAIIIQQNKIIAGFVDVKEDNLKLQEELICVKETVKNAHKEIDELHKKSVDELKSLQDSHEEEVLQVRQQYQKQQQLNDMEYKEKELLLKKIITELKQNIETMQTEKNIVIEVTVREYEDRLKSLRAALEESNAERKALEERHITNISLYKKKLEFQEQNYISMLEAVRKEVIVTNTVSNSVRKFKQSHHQVPENPNMSTVKSAALITKPRVQMPILTSQSDIYDETSCNSDLPVNISYYNHLQIPLPHSGHLISACSHYSNETATSSSCYDHDAQNKNEETRDVYNYINSTTKHDGISERKCAIPNQNNDESNNTNNNLICKIKNDNTNKNKQFSISINRMSRQKKRKLFNPESINDFI